MGRKRERKKERERESEAKEKKKKKKKDVTHSRSRRSQQQTVIDIAPVVLASWTKQRKGVRVELGSFRVDSRRGMGPFYRERGNVVCMFLSFVSFVLSFPFFFLL